MGLLGMMSKILVEEILVLLQELKQFVSSQRTPQNVGILSLVWVLHEYILFKSLSRDMFLFIFFTFAVVMAGEDSELLVGMKNEGNVLLFW